MVVGWEMAISHSLLHRPGPGGLRLSHPHCAIDTDGAILLTQPPPRPCAWLGFKDPLVFYGTGEAPLSAAPYVVLSGFVCATTLHGGPPSPMDCAVSLTSAAKPWGVMDAGKLCSVLQYFREGATFSYFGLRL